MKIPIWLKQSLVQILIYICLYEIILNLLKTNNLIKLNLSLGITSIYMFYLFIFLSVILSIIILIKKKNIIVYSLTLIFMYILLSLFLFDINNKFTILLIFISITSILSSFYIVNRKVKVTNKND